MLKIWLFVLVPSLMVVPWVWSEDPPGRDPLTILDPGVLLWNRQEEARQLLAQRFLEEDAERHRTLYQRPPTQTCPAEGERRTPAPGLEGEQVDLCEIGRRIAELTPCLKPQDCQAYLLWSQRLGPPVPRRAVPPWPEVGPGSSPEDQREPGPRSLPVDDRR